MRNRSRWIIGMALLAVMAIGVMAYEAGRQSAVETDSGSSVESEPTIHVAVVAIRTGRMDRRWTLFGTVSPLSSSVHAYSLPFETRIDRLHVSGGQHVEADAPLFDTRRSLISKVAAEAAMDFLKEAKQSLHQVRVRESDGLATRAELIQAEGRFRRAEQQVDAMRQSGQLEENLTTRASLSGVVANPGNQVGALIPAGLAILSISEDASIGVQLWADPAKARDIHVGMPVSIEALAKTSSISAAGHVLRVDEQVDGLIRLVRVSVIFDEPGAIMLGENVRGQIAVDAAEGFVVPRAALVALEGHSSIYLAEGGRARARRVDVIVEGKDEVLIRGENLKDGQDVITRGAYQSEDGLRVEIDR